MASYVAEGNVSVIVLLLKEKNFFQEVTHRQKFSLSILMRYGKVHQLLS